MAIHIKVRVETGSKKERIEEKGDRLVISVREPAEEGRANARVLEVMRGRHPGQEVRLIHGHHSPHKIFQIGL